MPDSSYPSPMLDIYINDTSDILDRLQQGVRNGYDRGPVTERLLSSTTETRGSGHRHDVEADRSNTLSEIFSNLRIDDRDEGGGAGGNSIAASQAVVDDIHTTSRSTRQPLPIPNADNDYAGAKVVDIQHESSESSSEDVHTLQHQSCLRKSDDGLFVIPGIPRKAQHPRGESQRTAAGKAKFRRHSIDKLSDGRDIIGEDQSRSSKLKRSASCTEQTTEPNAPRLLACPYLKYAPTKYFKCMKKFYKDIHCLKEHIYRDHKQPPHCFRCGEKFLKEPDVKAHLSRPQICDFVEGVSFEGITKGQHEELRIKKRNMTEEDKWRDMFRIVFPDATHCPDPCENNNKLEPLYMSTDKCVDYPYFEAHSNHQHQNLLSMNRSDVESIFSGIPSVLEDRMFANLESVFGRLDGFKRRKVRDEMKSFVVEGFQQTIESKGLRQSNVDVAYPDGSGSGSLVFETAAMKGDQHPPEAQHSATQTLAKEQRQSAAQMIPNTDAVETWPRGSLQEDVDWNLFNLANEQIFGEVLSGHEEIVGLGNETQASECANVERPVSIPSGSIVCETFAFDTPVPFQDSVSFLQADDDSFDLDSILNGTEDDFAPADWSIEHANL